MSSPHSAHHEDVSDAAKISPQDFKAISEVAYKNFGLSLAKSKQPTVSSRVTKRLRALGLDSVSSYLKFVDSASGADERTNFVSALTTNVTYFFREDHHFDLFRKTALRSFAKSLKSGGRVRIWSAGCSTGQEPYSIAMAILNEIPEAGSLDIKVLATDIDPVVVERAQTGIYNLAEVEGIPADMRQRYLDRDANNAERFRISENARNLVSFGVLNLIESLPISGPFDAIFCRNVAIYFDAETQHGVWERLINVLGKDRYLFVGHSEQVIGPSKSQVERVGPTTYQKTKP